MTVDRPTFEDLMRAASAEKAEREYREWCTEQGQDPESTQTRVNYEQAYYLDWCEDQNEAG